MNREFLKMLLDGGYVPVISPIGLSDEGGSLHQRRRGRRRDRRLARGEEAHLPHGRPRHPRVLARRRAGAPFDTADLGRRVQAGAVTGGMKWKAQSILAALAGGAERVHVLDGRQPHTVIAELFTDRGVGSLVTAS